MAIRNVGVVGITRAHTPQFIYLVTLKIASLQRVSLLLTSWCSSKRCILLPSSAAEKFAMARMSGSGKLS